MSQVTIVDAGQLVIPQACLVCGDPNAEFVPYSQESFPILAPLVGIARSMEVEAPYCERHYRAFRWRFRMLRVAQFLIIAVLIAVVTADEFGVVPPLPPPYASLATFGLLAAFVMTWVVKSRLYDVWFHGGYGGLRLSSPHQAFIETVRQANQGNAV